MVGAQYALAALQRLSVERLRLRQLALGPEEAGEVVDVTPAPLLVDLVYDTKPFTMGAWDGKPGHIRRHPVAKQPTTGPEATQPMKKPGDAFGAYSFQVFSGNRRLMSGSSPLLDLRNNRVGTMWNNPSRKSNLMAAGVSFGVSSTPSSRHIFRSRRLLTIHF